MSKKSTIITNLLVVPLIASTILLSSPAFAADPSQASGSEVRHKTSIPDVTHGIAGVVSAINGDIVVVASKTDAQYTVDASGATIMKVADGPNENPDVVHVYDIHVGDSIVVRGEISDSENGE